MDLEQQNYNTRSNSQGCSKVLKGCAIITVIVCVLFVGLLVWVSRMPGINNVNILVKCQKNMVEVASALRRYHDVNNAYPATLQELSKDYLKDPSVIYCPAEKGGKGDTTYTYHQPKPDSPNSFIALEYKRQLLGSDSPSILLRVTLGGDVKTEVIQPNTPKSNPGSPKNK